jgi:hypothetical protein
MNREQIKVRLDTFYHGLESIGLPKQDLELGTFIAGGCIASMVLDQDVKDFDVWFRDAETYEKLVALLVERRFVISRTSRFGITFQLFIHADGFWDHAVEVQFIKNRIGHPDQTVAGFDFKHTQSYFIPYGGIMKVDEEHIKSRKLVYVPGNLEHPVNTVERVLKFVRRGFFVEQQTIIDLMKDIQKADPMHITSDHAGSR